MRRVIGIDIGVRHMAVAEVHVGEDNDAPPLLHDVALVSLVDEDAPATAPVRTYVDRLPRSLSSLAMLSERDDVTTYVIEQQPTSTPEMRILSHCVQTFLQTRALLAGSAPCAIVFQSARVKLKPALTRAFLPPSATVPTADSLTYAQRKRLATAYLREWTTVQPMGDSARSRISSTRKLDDVADAFLHALHYAMKQQPRKRRRRE